MLRLDQKMLLSIGSDEAPLGLDDDPVRKREIWRVLGLLGRLGVGDDLAFVLGINPLRTKLLHHQLFQT